MTSRVAAARHLSGPSILLVILIVTIGLAAPAAAAMPCGTSIVVGRGDTLSEIAERCQTSIYLLTKVNPGLEPRTLRVGQKLIMPTTEDSPSVSIAPREGPVGTGVRIDASNFPPESVVQIGGGPPDAEPLVMGQLKTNRDGRLVVSIKVPAQAEHSEEWVFVVETTDQRHEAVSDPFHVAQPTVTAESAAKPTMTVSGMLTDAGLRCKGMRGLDGKLYALEGDLAGFSAGDRVRVIGSRPASSVCDEGTPISVRHIQQDG